MLFLPLDHKINTKLCRYPAIQSPNLRESPEISLLTLLPTCVQLFWEHVGLVHGSITPQKTDPGRDFPSQVARPLHLHLDRGEAREVGEGKARADPLIPRALELQCWGTLAFRIFLVR